MLTDQSGDLQVLVNKPLLTSKENRGPEEELTQSYSAHWCPSHFQASAAFCDEAVRTANARQTLFTYTYMKLL